VGEREFRAGRKEELASLALRYAVAKAWRIEREIVCGKIAVRTVFGVPSMEDLEANVDAAREFLKPAAGQAREGIEVSDELDEDAETRDSPLFFQIRELLGSWLENPTCCPQPVVHPQYLVMVMELQLGRLVGRTCLPPTVSMTVEYTNSRTETKNTLS
jgi:hypothetical protein